MNDFIKSGEFIANLRKEKGLTQQEIGLLLGVGDKTVSKWERGINVPDVIMIKKLAELFGVGIEEILNGEKSAKMNPKIIKSYENKKIRYTFFTILGIFFILFFLLLIYFCNNYDKFKVYRFKSSAKEYELTGNIYQVSNKYKMVIDDFIVNDTSKYDKLKIDTYKVSIFLEGNLVYYYTENITDKELKTYSQIIDVINKSDLVIQRPKILDNGNGYLNLKIIVGEEQYTEIFEFKNMVQERNNAFFYDIKKERQER